MFYAHFVLAKKGPLAKIWLAAHWDKKLTKAHVFETNIEKSVDGILKPKVKMALRTSGHLLLGVVRIYSRKAKYLLQDCNEAFVKIKMAFRPGMVDLPEEHREAAMNAITLPEVFHDFDTAMPELNEVDIEAQFSLNQSRAEEITMREDYGSLNLVAQDDGFGDMGFDNDNPDIMREAIGNEGALEQSNLLFADGSSLELGGGKESVAGPAPPSHGGPEPNATSVLDRHRQMEAAPHAPIDDGFGGTIGDVDDFGHAGGLFEGDLFGDVTAGSSTAAASGMPGSSAQPQSLQQEIEAATVSGEAEAAAAAAEAPHDPDSDDDMPDHYDAGDSPHHSWGGSQHEDAAELERPADSAAELMPPPSVPRPPSVMPMEVDPTPGPSSEIPAAGPSTEEVPAEEPVPEHDNTTLLQNDEESFALAPVDATILKGLIKAKRKRKLIVDEVKNISGEEMKNQLSNTSDIVTSLDLAPPTRRLMHWKETGGVEKLFALPARPIPSRILFKKYQRNMTLRADAEEEAARGEAEAVRRGAGARSPDHEPPATTRRSARKRKHEEIAPPPEPEAPAEMEPATPAPPVPQEYEPSIEHQDEGPQTPGYPLTPGGDVDPQTPGGMLSSLGPPLTPQTLIQGGLTPAGLQHGGMTPGGMTPGGLQHGDMGQSGDLSGMTPAGLHHGGMTPVGLHHGGMTPIGLQHGGMTPAGLHHGGMTPARGGMTPGSLQHGGMSALGLGMDGGMTPGGLEHGGLTPAGLQHGGLTPAGLQHGGLTPVGLHHGGLTPAGLHHGGLTPAGLHHGGLTPAGLHHGGMTPGGLHHGGMTPAGLQHGLVDDMPMMPHLPGDQVSSLLGESGNVSTTAPAPAELDHTVPMEPLPLHGLVDQPHYPNGMAMANLGYDEQQGHQSPQRDDYDLPPSVEQGEEGEREAGETDEQFEERVLNRRAAQLFSIMRPKLQVNASLTFRDIAPKHNMRKQVAQKFYSLLVLKKYQVLSLAQEETYGEIIITKGTQFETDSL